MLNGNGHKCLLVINKADKVIHDSSKVLEHSMWHNHEG